MRRTGAVSRDATAALDLEYRGLDADSAAPEVISGRAVSNGPTAAFSPSKRRSQDVSFYAELRARGAVRVVSIKPIFYSWRERR
jgi:hypothetical protein